MPDTIYNIQRVHYSLQYFNNSLLLSPARRGRGILVAPALGVTFFNFNMTFLGFTDIQIGRHGPT